MRLLYHAILFILLSLTGIDAQAQTFNWSGDGYKNYSKGGSYKNVDGSGVDLKVIGLHNDKLFGKNGVRTGINNQVHGDLVHVYQLIFSQEVDVKFTITNIDLDTMGGWCFIDDVMLSGNPELAKSAGVTVYTNNLIVPSNDGKIQVHYPAVDTIVIKHGRGSHCNPGYIGISDLNFKALPNVSSGPSNFQNILFETGKSIIRPQYQNQLDSLINHLEKYEALNIELIGHTDDIGAEKSNNSLANSRAKVVSEYLQSHGISTSRITLKNKGEYEPVLLNESDANRSQNRRVEIRILQ